MGKDILLLFYSIAFCNLEIVRQCANLSTSQAYGCEGIRQILDFLRCNFKNHLDTVCPASASQYSIMSPDKNVTSIERSWLSHLCNSLDQDPRSWPEEGGPKRVSWNPWQKAKRKVLIHHLHVFEPFSSKSWRLSSALSGKNLKPFSIEFSICEAGTILMTPLLNLLPV